MNKKLLVCDLDDTLYDWVAYFVPSFYAMVDCVVAVTGCDRETLLDDFRVVHRRYQDSEQPFALLETKTIKRIYANADWRVVRQQLDPAFHAFNSERKRNLRLHSGVKETLEQLRQSGVKLVAHTESKLYGAVDRLHRLDLFEFFSRIYCRERNISLRPPDDEPPNWLSRFPMEKITELSQHQTKPNPAVLLEICETENISKQEAAYIGDNVARDVLMAKRAGVFSIWAAYGAEHNATLYEALVRISHRTRKQIKQERQLIEEAKAISPDFIAHRDFPEVLSIFDVKI